MDSKTYFFRDSYSIYEMIQRINKEEFLELVNSKVTNGALITKEEAINYFANNFTEEEQLAMIVPFFQAYGKKGDNLNVQLLTMKNTGLEVNNENQVNILQGLIGKDLARLPFLSALCTIPCELVDVRVNRSKKTVDYKFRFEIEKIEDNDGKPISKIQYMFIECRHYLDQGVIAVVETRKTERKVALGLAYVIPYYIQFELQQHKNKVAYSSPEFNEIEIFPAQLDLLKQFLRGKLKSAEYMLEGEKNVKVKIDGSTEDFEIESNYLKYTSSRGKSLSVSFFYTDSSYNKSIVQIKSNAQIISTACVDENTLERVIKLINRINSYKDYMYPFDEIINKYCNYIKRGMITRARIKHNTEVLNGITNLINKLISTKGLNFKPTHAYINIVTNIIILLLQTEKYSSTDQKDEFEISPELTRFLKVFLKHNYLIDIDDNNINAVIRILYEIISKAEDNEEILIDICSNKYM